ncbi:MAG: hypothetical protein E6K54_03570 [Gammaproteobacteria bacterium]|nr:MAG: hypothetical protein E6K54_03570 [Gammaproteobacteria bacterium]
MINVNYFHINLNSEDMINLNHHKKYLIKKFRFFSLKFIKKLSIILKYSLRLLLVYIFKIVRKVFPCQFIIKLIPKQLKITIKAKLIFYPKISKLIKFIFNWLKDIKTPDKNVYLEYILPLLIKNFCLPFLKLILTKKNWRLIILQQLKDTPHLQIRFKQLVNDNTNPPSPNTFYSENNKNVELSLASLEIYKKLKKTIEYYES